MARPADNYAGSPVRRPHTPESEAAVVLTPDGYQGLLARAAWLASQPDQAAWGDRDHPHGAAELAQLHRILGQAITTEQLPPSSPAWSSSATR